MASSSSKSAERSSRQADKIYLIGYMTHQITGSKLPSNSQVLRSLFYNIRQVKLNIKDAARLTIQEVLIFWEKARIQTKHLKDCIGKLEKLHEEWRKLQKNANRTTAAQTEKEEAFKALLDDLFDIAHLNALQTATEEDKLFLLKQREKGRPGCMGGIDFNFIKAEERRQKKHASEMTRLAKSKKSVELEEFESVESSTSDEEGFEDNVQCTEEVDIATLDDEPDKKKKKYTRGTEEIINEKLSLLLDRCAISDRDAARIISATIESLGHDSQKFVVSRSIIRLRRQEFRKERAKFIQQRFINSDLEGAVVHWDGKLLPDILNKENVERVAVLISCGEEEQLIGVPQLENSTGNTVAKSVYSALEQWGALDKIQAMCFDTTAANTGRIKGACVLLEQLMGKTLLYLPCRHHILEVVLRSVFDGLMGKTTGPQPDIFKKFQTEWPKIDKKKFKPGIEDKATANKLINPDEMANYLLEQLTVQHPRDDYKELINLCLTFLGRFPSENIVFATPGAFHHARWMAKAIYSMKIYLFREQFKLTDLEKKGFHDLCLFIVNIYVKVWLDAPKPTLAPNQDLQLIKSLEKYRKINKQISDITLSKIINHLWYLNPEQAAFALFDDTISNCVKRRMAMKLIEQDQDEELDDCDMKPSIKLSEIPDLLEKDVDHFISLQSVNFFKRFKISTEFLHINPELWSENEEYLKGKQIVNGLRVVNDTAERGVKLITDYNSYITKDEEQRQYLLQVVSECRANFPGCSKASLSKPLPSQQ